MKPPKFFAAVLAAALALGCVAGCNPQPPATQPDGGTPPADIQPAEEFTVTFNPAGGTLEGENTFTLHKGDQLDLSQYVPRREGYTFKGWQNGQTLYAGGTFTVTQNVQFTAVWTMTPSAAENFVFEETEGGYTLAGFAQSSALTRAVIPDEYLGQPIVRIADAALGYSAKLTSVDLSNCVHLKEIGNWNFSSCPALTSVNLQGCSALIKIGDCCFQGDALTQINLKGLTSLQQIGYACFRGASGISLGQLPVEELDFTDCVSLNSIGKCSFWNLSRVRDLNFSHTKLTDLGIQTVMHCPALESISLPATLNLTEGCAESFGDCKKLGKITLDPLNIFMTVENGALMDADKTTLFKYEVASSAATFTAPSSVKRVMSWAFYGAEGLTEINFAAARPNQINYNAFNGCTGATLNVPFGQDGTYEDGSPACALGKDWNCGVKQTQYGEAAKAFVFTASIAEGEIVQGEEYAFTASAEYGPSYALVPCELTVKVNGAEISGQGGSYVATLKEGQNTIELIASCGQESQSKTYTVNRAEKPALNTDLAEGYAFGVMKFGVWAESGGRRQDLSGKTLEVLFAWQSSNYGSFNAVWGNYVTCDYNAEKMQFEVSVDIDGINAMYFEDGFKIKLAVQGYAAEPLILSFEYQW